MARLHLCFTLLVSFSTLAFAAPDRIREPLDKLRVTKLRGYVHTGSRTQDDRGPVAADMKLSYVTVLLKPDPSLEGFLAQQQTPSSPAFHKWLSPQQFGDRFGASSNDLTTVAAWLKSENLQVHDIARGGLWITFSGTAERVGQALHTNFHHYRWTGKLHYSPIVEPSVPDALLPLIAAFDGLDDFGPEPAIRAGARPDFNSGSLHYLAPDDIATIYNTAGLYAAGIDGAGQKIAVIGQTAVDLADVRAFRARFNLAPNDPRAMLFGADPGVSNGDLEEANLDLEWAGAVARNATVLYVYSQGVYNAAQYAVDNNVAPVMSLSYGGCEQETSIRLRTVAQQANAQGITWLVSSGDSGAANCDRSSPTPQASRGNTISYPANLPEVTAVGGTQFDEGSGSYWASSNGPNGGSALSYIPERAWNTSEASNSLRSAGGGASAYFSKPVWQTGPGVPNDNARDVPDVSVSGSPDHDGYLINSGGQSRVVGGTSAGTPVFAGMAVLLNQYLAAKGQVGGLGNINPTLYRMAQTTTGVFHDVVNGDNKVPCAQSSPNCVDGMAGYSAGPGYDLATGLGSVDAYQLAAQWDRGANSTVTLTVTPTTVSLTGTVQLLARVTSSGIDMRPTGTVSFLANDLVIGSAAVDASGLASVTVQAPLIVAGNGTVSALYSGDGVFLGSGATAPVTLNLPTASSAVIVSLNPNPVNQVGTSWPYTITIADKSSVAATITAFTVDGLSNLVNLSTTRIPANGALTLSLSGSGLTPPVNRNFHFAGTDAAGGNWTQDLTVPFVGPLGKSLAPALTLTSAPATVQQDPQAPASCQWQNRLTVSEEGGFLTQLTRLTAGTTDFSSQLPQLFGTTRLAPYGKLQAKICWSGLAVPSTRTFQIVGTTELGTVSAALTATFAAPAGSASSFSVSEPAVVLSSSQTHPVSLSFGGGSPSWSAVVAGSKAATNWLTVSPASGSGSGDLTLQVSDAGLSKGVYQATVQVQASDAVPALIEIPVTFVVGASAAVSIGGVANSASFGTTLAPGAIMSVFGTGLAAGLQSAPKLPLPLTLAGVSATVNGVTAPVYFASSGQLNVQVPYETGAGPAVLGVNYNGQVAAFPFTVAPAAPGIFAAQDKSLVPSNTGTAGQVLLAFVTGEGDVTPSIATGATSAAGTAVTRLPQPRQAFSLTVGGVPAAVAFVGIPSGLAGATQVNFTVPAGLTPGPQPVVVTVGGVESTPVTLTVK